MNVISCLKNEKHAVTKMYKRLTNRGIHHYSAATACMRKLLSIAYGIMKSGKDFDINYENTKKAEEQSVKTLKTAGVKIKKCESFDLEAPVSKKEKNRRKKVAMSQKSTVDFSTGSNATVVKDTTLNKRSKLKKNKNFT